MLAVHVHLAPHALANSELGKLRLFEICVDPDLLDGANRHNALTCNHVIARIYAFACYRSVDFGVNLAIAEIQLRLVEIALRLM